MNMAWNNQQFGTTKKLLVIPNFHKCSISCAPVVLYIYIKKKKRAQKQTVHLTAPGLTTFSKCENIVNNRGGNNFSQISNYMPHALWKQFGTEHFTEEIIFSL